MNWIKVETHTPRKGEIVRLAATMGVSRREAFAMYFEFLDWVDSETSDGRLDGYTIDTVDQAIDNHGFARALIDVGWLLQDSRGLIIPNFDRHNGESAKKRAMNTERQRRRRAGNEQSA